MEILSEWEKHKVRCISTFFTFKTWLKCAELAFSYRSRATGNLQTRRMFLFDACGRKNAKVHICMRKHEYHISCGINFLRHARNPTHYIKTSSSTFNSSVWVARKRQGADGQYHFCTGVASSAHKSAATIIVHFCRILSGILLCIQKGSNISIQFCIFGMFLGFALHVRCLVHSFFVIMP